MIIRNITTTTVLMCVLIVLFTTDTLRRIFAVLNDTDETRRLRRHALFIRPKAFNKRYGDLSLTQVDALPIRANNRF